MKITLTLMTLLLVSQSYAAPVCYKVDNPQAIIILGDSASGQIIDNKIEQAREAHVKIDKQPDGSEVGSTLELKAVSATMKFSTFAGDYQNKSGYRDYAVDCDGGSAVAMLMDGKLTLRSVRMSGEVTASDGCSSGSVAIMGAALLTEVQCAKAD